MGICLSKQLLLKMPRSPLAVSHWAPPDFNADWFIMPLAMERKPHLMRLLIPRGFTGVTWNPKNQLAQSCICCGFGNDDFEMYWGKQLLSWTKLNHLKLHLCYSTKSECVCIFKKITNITVSEMKLPLPALHRDHCPLLASAGDSWKCKQEILSGAFLPPGEEHVYNVNFIHIA